MAISVADAIQQSIDDDTQIEFELEAEDVQDMKEQIQEESSNCEFLKDYDGGWLVWGDLAGDSFELKVTIV
jgi:hypothetical protein